MNDEVIAHMRDRIQRIRKVIELAHNPHMTAMLEQMIRETEADIIRLEGQTATEANQESPKTGPFGSASTAPSGGR